MGGMVREFDRKVTQGPPVLCAAHVQYLGRGPAAYGTHGSNNAAEVNNRALKDQRKAGATPVPIPELDTKRLVSSKVSYTSLPRASLCTIVTRPPARRSVVDRPATGINHPRRNRAVRYALQFQWSPYVQLIFRIASCESHTYHQPAIATGP